MVVVSIYLSTSSVVSIEVAQMNIVLSDDHDQMDFKFSEGIQYKTCWEMLTHVFSADLEESAEERCPKSTLQSTQ